jgi:hypothetical protein
MTEKTHDPRRREFIPAIREGLAGSVPASPQAVNDAIDNWRDGNDPAHPLEAGVFAMCDEMARRLDEAEAKNGQAEKEAVDDDGGE